ncbi:PREDICTED: uncharacterized protein LOC109591134, partial [Amphimedon queenslandica]|uniref:Nucleoside phosphorylase domain-containing protein n=1 Tax=Amphimedon queenslandica TaxID=400682 RepID=A0AAN0JZZ8_AMPQE
KKPDLAAVKQIFDSSDDHYLTIGAGLKVKTADLIEMPGTASTKLHLVFQRWFDADRDVNWDTLIKLCDDNPDKLGKAKSNLLEHIGKAGLAESNGTAQANAKKQKIDPKEPIDSAATGEDKSKSEDQKSDPPPDVSKYCPKLEDIERKIEMKTIEELTEGEKEFISKVRYILVTATTIEYCAVMGSIDPPGGDGKYIRVITTDETGNFILGKYGSCNVAITRTGQGPDETEDILVSVQNDVKADFVIAIGICYGAKESKTEELSDKTNLGDIIVAKSIIDTAHQRIEGKNTIVLATEYHCGKNLLKKFKHDEVFKIEGKAVKVHHQGSLASEFTLFRSKEAKEEKLKYIQKALGGEMEAKGIHKAAESVGFEWIVIKAIVDWGTEEKDKKWQPFGAVSCARFVLQRLKDQQGNQDQTQHDDQNDYIRLHDEEGTRDSLKQLNDNFSLVMMDVEEAFDNEIQDNPKLLKKITTWLRYREDLKYHADTIATLNNVSTIGDVLTAIRPLFDCTDCALLVNMCQQFIPNAKEEVSKLESHHERAKEFCQSTTVQQLKEDLEKKYCPHLATDLKTCPRF